MKIKFCPRCKSTDVSISKSNPLQGAYGLPATYVCYNCGYKSYFFPEANFQNPEEKKKFEKSTSKSKTKMVENKEIDVNYGNFLFRLINFFFPE